MKQKCQLQMGIALYKNAATPLKIKGINTTHYTANIYSESTVEKLYFTSDYSF